MTTMLNAVVLIGRLTRDPELRYTGSGGAVCNFDLALNHKWKDKNGELQEEVTFIPITAWGKTAEIVSEYLKKGRQTAVEGRLKQERWETEAGEKRTRLIVVASRVTFLGDGGGGGGKQQRESAGIGEDGGDVEF